MSPREWIATLDGYVNAQIRPQVSGYLVRRTTRRARVVRKGEVLFEIDPRPFEAALAQAEARLAEAQAQLGTTERDRRSATGRWPTSARSRRVSWTTTCRRNLAAQAAVKAAKAAVETAQLNLGFTKVTSLIDGIAAIATAQIGDLVGPTTLLTTVSQVDPIQGLLLRSASRSICRSPARSTPAADADALGQAAPALTLVLADGSVYPRRGAFLAADREIDPKTGTIRISATFPNPEQRAAARPVRPRPRADTPATGRRCSCRSAR